MNPLSRRIVLSGAVAYSLANSFSSYLSQAVEQMPRLYGVNAYYLLVESYRQAREQPGRALKDVVMDYLTQSLRLDMLRRNSRINALRFWAFNDYPISAPEVPPGVFDGALWQAPNQPVEFVFRLLDTLVACLSELGFWLVAVLGNYWLSYGGILRYLEWAEAVPPGTWLNAFLTLKDQDKYLQYGPEFYLNKKVEQIFQSHTGEVLGILGKYPSIIAIDILNEPRGKGIYAQENRPVKPNVFMQQIVADWLQRQAVFIQGQIPRRIWVSSGEEGWLNQPPRLSLNYLRAEPQFYEGIDLALNMTRPALTLGSIHMYTHPAVELTKTTILGLPFLDRRGWDFLLRSDRPPTRQTYRQLGDEWLRSRALAMHRKPWYLGELGWCRPRSLTNRRPLSSHALQSERIVLYRHWAELAFNLGARGVFLWLLNGRQHQDEFYGMTPAQIQAIFPR